MLGRAHGVTWSFNLAQSLGEELTATEPADGIPLLRDCTAAWALSKECPSASNVYVENH